MIQIYGLKNCDKCRAALRFAKSQGLDHTFHDIREESLDPRRLERWLDALGWEQLLNRKSTTWRSLGGAEREDLDREKVKSLILAHPTLAKRPIIECVGQTFAGFDKARKDQLMAAI
ncbi:MAG: Spx/MgsR family RNA polymerase-binding regulatory protein [Kiloniellales bacterium]|nr:Spx/MgsR family RNA polymerase-binding regulatory protein [Kiloniellales bacterium]